MVNRVLGNVFSTRTQRVLFVLEELGVQYEFQSLDFAKDEHHVRLTFRCRSWELPLFPSPEVSDQIRAKVHY